MSFTRGRKRTQGKPFFSYLERRLSDRGKRPSFNLQSSPNSFQKMLSQLFPPRIEGATLIVKSSEGLEFIFNLDFHFLAVEQRGGKAKQVQIHFKARTPEEGRIFFFIQLIRAKARNGREKGASFLAFHVIQHGKVSRFPGEHPGQKKKDERSGKRVLFRVKQQQKLDGELCKLSRWRLSDLISR